MRWSVVVAALVAGVGVAANGCGASDQQPTVDGGWGGTSGTGGSGAWGGATTSTDDGGYGGRDSDPCDDDDSCCNGFYDDCPLELPAAGPCDPESFSCDEVYCEYASPCGDGLVSASCPAGATAWQLTSDCNCYAMADERVCAAAPGCSWYAPPCYVETTAGWCSKATPCTEGSCPPGYACTVLHEVDCADDMGCGACGGEHAVCTPE
jgi:hypothetical protein